MNPKMESTTISTASIREELYWADKVIERSRDRDEAIEREIRLRYKFNKHSWDNSEVVFEVTDKKPNPYCIPAQVEVLPFDDGKYCVSYVVNLSLSGCLVGFSPTEVFPDKRTASRAGVEMVLAYATGELLRSDSKAVEKQARRIAQAAQTFLESRVQPSLF